MPGDPSSKTGFWGSLLNISQTLQSVAQEIAKAVTALGRLVPSLSSGQLSADAIVQNGFVRLTGIEVVAAGSPVGTLHDAATIATAAAGNEIAPIPTAVGFYPVQILFTTGMVYKAGTSEKIALFYARV